MTDTTREALAADIKAAIAELAQGRKFPDLIAAIDALATPEQEPAVQAAVYTYTAPPDDPGVIVNITADTLYEYQAAEKFGAAVEDALDDYPVGGDHIERIKGLVTFWQSHQLATGIEEVDTALDAAIVAQATAAAQGEALTDETHIELAARIHRRWPQLSAQDSLDIVSIASQGEAPPPSVPASDEQILQVFADAGILLTMPPNGLYTVRGQHSQLLNAARRLLSAAPPPEQAAQPAVPLTDEDCPRCKGSERRGFQRGVKCAMCDGTGYALATPPAQVEQADAALWKRAALDAIAALERTGHATKADRFKAANALRLAIAARKEAP